MKLLIFLFTASLGAQTTDRPMLPDPALTPGAIDPRVTQDNIHSTICQPGYTATVRSVSGSEKKQVYAEYHMKAKHGVCCEIDHLISLELAGSNIVTNLWPQPYLPKPGAHEKDTLENALHRAVCNGTMKLYDAQKCITGNWFQCAQSLKAIKQ